MTCIYNTKDYLQKKLSGEVVVSAATLYGYNAKLSDHASDPFYVLIINNNDYSLFKYSLNKGKFHVVEFTESIPHTLSDAFTLGLVHDHVTMKWWNAVFFEQNEVCSYDNYYNNLKISDNSIITFKELLAKVSSAVASLKLSCIKSCLFLSGDLSSNHLLRYVLQKELHTDKIFVLPNNNGEEDFEENEVVSIPEKLSERYLRTAPVIKMESLLSKLVNITLPLHSIENDMLPDIKWKDILFNLDKDYSSSDIDFKKVSISIECDVFQNVFLTSLDLRGNKKVIQIK